MKSKKMLVHYLANNIFMFNFFINYFKNTFDKTLSQYKKTSEESKLLIFY